MPFIPLKTKGLAKSGKTLSSFDRDFKRNFEAVEETVVLEGDIAAKLLERHPPGDPEIAKEHRLLVVDPSGQEWEYPIRGEVLIGRADDNHITLEDRAVSRHHLAINTDGKLYWFQDLNSGNGTQLNGEDVHEGWLVGGEELLIGNSHIYFLVPESDENAEQSEENPEQSEENPEQSEQEASDSSKKWLIPILIVFLLGIGMSIAGGWWVYQKYIKPPPPVIKEDPIKKAMQLLATGKKFIKQHRWREADRILRQAASEVPSSNPIRTIILEHVTRVGRELTAQIFFKRAKQLYLEEDKGREALALLRKVPKRTQTYRQALRLKRRIFNKDIRPIIREISILLIANKPKEAQQRLQQLLAYDTHHPKIIAIRDRVEQALAHPKPKLKAAPKPVEDSPRKRFSGTIRQGISYFRTGEIARAIIFFRRLESGASSRRTRRRARRYRQKAQAFQYNLLRGRRLARRGSTRAIKYLLRAHRAARYLGGGHRSKYASLLAKMLYKRGRSYQRRKRYVSAYRDFKLALAFKPHFPQVKAAIRQLQRNAQELYNQAMVLKDVDNQEARKLLLQVLKMLPPSSPLYRKAKRQL